MERIWGKHKYELLIMKFSGGQFLQGILLFDLYLSSLPGVGCNFSSQFEGKHNGLLISDA